MAGASWGVVATVDEPAPLVAAMVAHHLAQGAAEVFIYLDRPDGDLRALIGDLPGVRIIECDAAYWAGQRHAGRHGGDHVWRQVMNANHAYARARVDWLLHCDADEFIADGAALAAELAALPAGVHSLIIPNVERFFPRGQGPGHLFDGRFRQPRRWYRLVGRLIHGADWRLFQNGLGAHALGKSVTRTRCARWVEIHRAARQRDTGRPTVFARSRGCRIVHFDGITPAHWQAKMRRLHAELPDRTYGRLSPTRRFVMRALDGAGDAGVLDRAFDRVQRAGLWQRLAMRAVGMIWPQRFDPRPGIARICPAALIGIDEFDAVLARRTAAAPTAIAAE